ncbi:Cold acclimation protein WCOR413 family [Klebsormidium nitens]|uniref:Cold acclimation protein WCOR413 family n=1 Tax=Klebsormidium nitens TaxID=105231 RepID=A0A1Y1I5P7_KLENI|nr:Cold acclimation protein WCOR413 family [Klebsormidium nitens]|eukprot:GAQ84036.1 Cold acclimation protein WCOR413 family [Klebsormidium nitens]
MASSCVLRSAFGVRNAALSPTPMSQSQVQARAICAAPALVGKKSLPQVRAMRSSSAESAFGSSRQLLGARTLPAQIQASRSQQKATGATGGALSSQAAYPAIFGLAPDTLQWIFTVASTALMFRLLPPVSHALLVPALFLNLPARVVEVMKQEAGAWVAVALVVLKLFSSQVPKAFDLPLAVLLSIIIAPYELLRFRGTQGAGIVSLAIGIYIAYDHVTANKGVDNTMRSDVLPTTFAIALVLLIPAAFLFGAYA